MQKFLFANNFWKSKYAETFHGNNGYKSIYLLTYFRILNQIFPWGLVSLLGPVFFKESGFLKVQDPGLNRVFMIEL